MAIGGAVTSFFILVVVIFYSAIVWRSLDQYFREEFKKHLQQDKTYQMMQKENIMKEIDSTEESVKLDVGDVTSGKVGCSKEKMPADKYKNQKDGKDFADNEVCPFVLPLSAEENNGG